MSPSPIPIFFEIGSKRAISGSIDWPGWCRIARDEETALAALLAYGPRYAAAMRAARLGFRAPRSVQEFDIVERVKGNATTDFGAPDAALAADAEPFDPTALYRFTAILRAAWKAFDDAVAAAEGVELRKGPRGGGRNLDKIVEHAWGGEAAYVGALGWKVKVEAGTPPPEALEQVHQALLDGLAAGARGELPERGPRGGTLWSPRRAVRRAAWHVLDHAWEIEDRAKGGEGGI